MAVSSALIDPERPFASAFPEELSESVRVVAASLPPARFPASTHAVGPIVLRDRRILIPARIYHPPPTGSDAAPSDVEAAILACIYTRHHDGFVRQTHLRRIVDCHHPWKVPFVVQLVGEYVLEILEDIDARLAQADASHLRDFAKENEPFLRLTRERVVSYWNCYFRRTCPDVRNHVGSRILTRIRAIATSKNEGV